MAQQILDVNAPRFFLDSSVILAGVISSKGASHVLLVLGELGLVRLVTIPYVLNEVERNLQKKRTQALPRYQQLRTLGVWELIANPTQLEIDVWMDVLPAKDVPILAAAVGEAVSRLITLDVKHFIDDLRVAQTANLNIATPRDVVVDIRGLLARGFAP